MEFVSWIESYGIVIDLMLLKFAFLATCPIIMYEFYWTWRVYIKVDTEADDSTVRAILVVLGYILFSVFAAFVVIYFDLDDSVFIYIIIIYSVYRLVELKVIKKNMRRLEEDKNL